LHELVRGEWRPPQSGESGRSLVEAESLRLGVEIPEALHDLQQAAVRRLRDSAAECDDD